MRIFAAVLLVFSILMSIHGAIAQVQQAQPDPYEDRNAFRSAGPITDAERNAPWPSRDQSAETYRDAFCKVWDDGCTKCERSGPFHFTHCVAINSATKCQRKPVQCTEMLPEQARVCLHYDDGCQEYDNSNGMDSSLYCRYSKITDFTCRIPRKSTYYETEGYSINIDLAGHGLLTDSNGNTCIVSLNSTKGFWISDPCMHTLSKSFSKYKSKFGTEPYENPSCPYSIVRDTLKIVCKKAHPQKLVFSIKNPEFPIGIGSIKGWRLTRISTLY